MPEVKRTHRIDDKVNGAWREFRTFDANATYEVVESYYDKWREENPLVEFRLVAVVEHECRSGRGRVYD